MKPDLGLGSSVLQKLNSAEQGFWENRDNSTEHHQETRYQSEIRFMVDQNWLKTTQITMLDGSAKCYQRHVDFSRTSKHNPTPFRSERRWDLKFADIISKLVRRLPITVLGVTRLPLSFRKPLVWCPSAQQPSNAIPWSPCWTPYCLCGWIRRIRNP